jgi:hypothetical protein
MFGNTSMLLFLCNLNPVSMPYGKEEVIRIKEN